MRRLPLPSFRHAALVVAALGLALAVLPGAALAQPDPAPPEPSKSAKSETSESEPAERCPGDSLCTWPSPDFAGSISEIPDAAMACHALPRSATSAMNDTSFPAEFFAEADCKGELITAVPVGGQATSFVKAASVRLNSPTPKPESTDADPTDAKPAETP